MASGLQVVTEFVTEVRRFILINSDHDTVMDRWAGVRIHIPGRTEALVPDQDNPTAFVSATDKDGSYIPGTLVLSDRYGPDGEGGEVLVFDAGQAVRYILGVNTRSGLATSAFARRGLSLLPRGSSRVDLERIRTAGYARSEAWRIQQARTLVEDIDKANALREKHKLPPIPGGHDYVRAVLELRAYQAREQELMRSVLSTEKPYVEPIEPLRSDEIESDRELADYLRAQIEEASAKVDMTVEAKQRLVEKVINDPEAMAILKRKFKMVERLRPVAERKPRAKTIAAPTLPTPPLQVTDMVDPRQPPARDTGLPPGVVEPTSPEAPVGMGGDLPQDIIDRFNDPEPVEEADQAPPTKQS